MPLPIPFRQARPASTAWNVTKTLVMMVPMWIVFFGVYPGILYLLEGALGLDKYRFASTTWEVVGIVLFVLASLLHLVSNLIMAVYGEGTPLFTDGPRKLVIAGPYRHVRNPMAIAALAQCAGVGLFLGSPAVLLGTLLLVVVEAWVLQPAEVADLERNFGEAYTRYRRRVDTWRPRWRGYDPAHESEEPAIATERTTPPGQHVLLYDGLCKFCTAGAKRLLAWVPAGKVDLLSFQDPGVLDRFPGVTREAAMQRMYLITPDGRVYGGFEAAVHAFALRPLLGWIAYAYYLPGLKLLFDTVYALIAANRYRIMGKAVAAGECEGGTCALHLGGQKGNIPETAKGRKSE